MDRSSILRASTTHYKGRMRGLFRSGSGAENAARLKPRRLRAKNDHRSFHYVHIDTRPPLEADEAIYERGLIWRAAPREVGASHRGAA